MLASASHAAEPRTRQRGSRVSAGPPSRRSIRSGAVTAPERTLDPESLGDHVDRLFRAAWALSGSRADAEDLVQETFARVLAKPRRIRNEDDLGYLLQVLRNTFISSRRAAARRLAPAALDDQLEPADPSAASRPEQ